MLVLYVVLIGGACYGASQIDVYFDYKYFVNEDSEIKTWFDIDDEYFTTGGPPTITYVESTVIDFSDTEVQNRIHAFNTAIQECKGCVRSWHQKQSVRSWYTEYTNWVSVGSCSLVTPA